MYQHWLPDSVQQKTLRDSGYYSVSLVNIQNKFRLFRVILFQILVKDKLRVISINANFCNNFNFWLLLNFNDPHHHLHWLYRQLHKAELKKENVFILGHIAPGTHSCLGKIIMICKKNVNHLPNSIFEGRWSHEYNRIVKRFNNTISAQFFGHTHFDEFQVFFNQTSPINMAYLAPSETSLDGLNPAYRIYTIDGKLNY